MCKAASFMVFAFLATLYGLLTETQTIDLTVAQDGTGQFTKIQDAIRAAPNNSQRRFHIKIKRGIYREAVDVGVEKTKITLIGDGMSATRIIGNKSIGAGSGNRTYDTSIVVIRGQSFVAINMSFENEAGPENGKAIALSSEVDSAFYKCSFHGYQDTLYARKGRQFYRECDIYGTIDFIFGNAALILQKSSIYIRTPKLDQYNVITAQGRDKPEAPTGTILHKCKIATSPEFVSRVGLRTFLGRPWETYSRVIVMLSDIGGFITPEGWIEWNNRTQFDKMFYREYKNTGAGNITSGRVKWPGYKELNSSNEVIPFTVKNFIQGDEWLPATGVPFDLNL